MSDNGSLKRKVFIAFVTYKKIDPETISIKKFEGGFTGASKFIVETERGVDNGREFFLKAANEKTHAVDVFLIESEAKIYSMLEKWRLTGVIFPAHNGLIDKDGLRILVLEYLSDVNWGGPWNENTITYLGKAFDKLHATKLSKQDRSDLSTLADKIRVRLGQKSKKDSESSTSREKKIRAFLDAWDNEVGGFKSDKGEIYFKSSQSLPKRIIGEVEKKDPNPPKQLIMHDLNYANIGLSHKQAFFIDPLFARIGDPLHDKTVAGINILQQLGELTDPKLRRIVVDKFLNSKPILARLIAYYVVTAAKDSKQSQLGWQKYHQECAIAALNVFVEWTQ